MKYGGKKKSLALALATMGALSVVTLATAPTANAEGCYYGGIPYTGLVHPTVANMGVRSGPRLSGVKICDHMSHKYSYRLYCVTSGEGGDWYVVLGDNEVGGYVPKNNLTIVQDGPPVPC
ncbi:hypothetical protein OG943_07620 [Amycolatopsis sp. NBC_00345]|uniref:hypothetical protein n=1 Tax=Amycolatopsis sp. NBC_00345 TaxID=2975955 RepID=UPI002E252626